MPLLTRRGFTLIELMVAVVLLGIVTAGIYRALVTNQQTFLAQTQRIDLQQNIRAAATILPAEFREMDAADSDITAMSATAITFRAMRQLAFICVAPVLGGGLGQISLTVRQRPFFGTRQSFSAEDSVLIYYEGDPATRNDDSWVRGKITGVANQNCTDPDQNRPGYQLTLQPQWIAGSQFNVAGAITNGSPVRGFETVTYQAYQAADNRWYLGQQKAGSTIQPLIGPLTGANGLTYTYYDANGNVTAVRTAVAQIEIRLRGQTVSPVRQATGGGVAYKVDSIVTRVALRNNPRCSPCL